MAATSTSGLPIAASAPAIPSLKPRTSRRRRIDARSGHALEILGHAIEYLTDEFVHQGGVLPGHNPQLEAVQLLMAVNRQVYFACPAVPTLGERCRALLHLHAA